MDLAARLEQLDELVREAKSMPLSSSVLVNRDEILDIARENGAVQDPFIRQRFVQQWSKIQIMRVNGLRTLSASLTGNPAPGQSSGQPPPSSLPVPR